MIETIYLEKELTTHNRALKILDRFPKARKIEISRYGEVFNKKDQNFKLQKQNPALILAKKHANFVLPVPSGFGFDKTKNFYFSHMLNCVYDCRYCFLQGMYTSANYLLFVNYEDFQTQIETIIQAQFSDRLAFFSGYDCDSLALENITGFVSYFLPIFRRNANALLELRTKSVQTKPLLNVSPLDNCVVAYSLMPHLMSKSLDHKTPSIDRRIEAMASLAAKGWKIGLRFDPLIYGKDWQKLYKELIEKIFSVVLSDSIHSVTFGSLRFPKKMFKKIYNLYPSEELFSANLSIRNDRISYSETLELEMIDFCEKCIREFVPATVLFDCMKEENISFEGKR